MYAVKAIYFYKFKTDEDDIEPLLVELLISLRDYFVIMVSEIEEVSTWVYSLRSENNLKTNECSSYSGFGCLIRIWEGAVSVSFNQPRDKEELNSEKNTLLLNRVTDVNNKLYTDGVLDLLTTPKYIVGPEPYVHRYFKLWMEFYSLADMFSLFSDIDLMVPRSNVIRLKRGLFARVYRKIRSF